MLENDVKDEWGILNGIYTFQGFSGGMDYWVHDDNGFAIWYRYEMVNGITNYFWHFGLLESLGTNAAAVVAISVVPENEKMCPNNEGYVWEWLFFDGHASYIDTKDIYIKCANEDDFCTSENPCGTNQGDCDNHDECQDGLVCGSNNCPDYLSFDSEFDCCYIPIVGDENFCKSGIPCGEDEGDCDSSNECQADLFCDPEISCPAYLGFTSDVNCCSIGSGCKF